jgi:hypothetical protein
MVKKKTQPNQAKYQNRYIELAAFAIESWVLL